MWAQIGWVYLSMAYKWNLIINADSSLVHWSSRREVFFDPLNVQHVQHFIVWLSPFLSKPLSCWSSTRSMLVSQIINCVHLLRSLSLVTFTTILWIHEPKLSTFWSLSRHDRVISILHISAISKLIILQISIPLPLYLALILITLDFLHLEI